MKQSLTTRMSIIKDQFPLKQYMTIYQMKFGVLTKEGRDRVFNVWNLRVEDKDIVDNFERLLKTLSK